MSSRRLAALLALPLLAAASGALAQPPADEQRVEISLSNFSFDPKALQLHHGGHYVLHIVNRAKGEHNFVAPAFFSAATIASADKARISDGKVDLSGGQAIDIHLTAPAAAAVYEIHCSHFGHEAMGMRGQIEVQ